MVACNGAGIYEVLSGGWYHDINEGLLSYAYCVLYLILYRCVSLCALVAFVFLLFFVTTLQLGCDPVLPLGIAHPMCRGTSKLQAHQSSLHAQTRAQAA